MTATAAKRYARKVALQLAQRLSPGHLRLNFSNPLELLVATILSAQCTDQRVNLVTKDLFVRYRRPADYAGAELAELERAIASTGFFRNKAKNIRGCCQGAGGKIRRPGPAGPRRAGAASRRGAEDGQRGVGHRLRHRRGRGGGHARDALEPAAGADAAKRSRTD